jgi:hypothetical protein
LAQAVAKPVDEPARTQPSIKGPTHSFYNRTAAAISQQCDDQPMMMAYPRRVSCLTRRRPVSPLVATIGEGLIETRALVLTKARSFFRGVMISRSPFDLNPTSPESRRSVPLSGWTSFSSGASARLAARSTPAVARPALEPAGKQPSISR